MPLAPGEPDNPGVAAPPPLLAMGPTLVALLLELVVPTTILPTRPRLVVGALLLVAGVAVNLSAFATQKRAGTDPLPEHPSTAIVARGPYSFTRNPMYVGFVLMAAGIAVLADSWWGLAALPVGIALVTWGAILREERYLERKFGDEYLAYRSKVRRWL